MCVCIKVLLILFLLFLGREGSVFLCIYIFKIYLLIMLLTVAPFPPLHSTPSCLPPPSHIPPYSSCLWVIHISSLASTFPILFLPSSCLFSTHHLCYLFSVPFPPLSPSHSPIDNPPCDLHFCGSVPVIVVCSPVVMQLIKTFIKHLFRNFHHTQITKSTGNLV